MKFLADVGLESGMTLVIMKVWMTLIIKITISQVINIFQSVSTIVCDANIAGIIITNYCVDLLDLDIVKT